METVELKLVGGTFNITFDDDGGGGTIDSNLHYKTLEEFLQDGGDEPSETSEYDYGHYEGCIDGVEALLLGLAMAGIEVTSKDVQEALQTALDAIGHETG